MEAALGAKNVETDTDALRSGRNGTKSKPFVRSGHILALSNAEVIQLLGTHLEL